MRAMKLAIIAQQKHILRGLCIFSCNVSTFLRVLCMNHQREHFVVQNDTLEYWSNNQKYTYM